MCLVFSTLVSSKATQYELQSYQLDNNVSALFLCETNNSADDETENEYLVNNNNSDQLLFVVYEQYACNVALHSDTANNYGIRAPPISLFS